MEILNGLRTYFDKALPAMLLYKQERGQYTEHIRENSTVTASSIYGAEHLLRLFGTYSLVHIFLIVWWMYDVLKCETPEWRGLFICFSVKLPELLVYTNMEDDALMQLQQKLADFLKYVSLFNTEALDIQ